MKRSKRLRLISWKDDRSAELRGILEGSGWTVDSGAFDATTPGQLADDPPAAVIIDLGRLPAQGRDVGVALRTRAGTRKLPIVFVDGAEEKVEKARSVLPDAAYLRSNELAATLPTAIDGAPLHPVVPSSNFAGYSATPLPKKLGIKPGNAVELIDAPDDFAATLGELPDGVTLHQAAHPEASVTLWFVRSLSALEEGIVQRAEIPAGGRLWICWPKKASGVETDLTQQTVRSTGLNAGIVDFKICAVDDTWSGLCFANRKA